MPQLPPSGPLRKVLGVGVCRHPHPGRFTSLTSLASLGVRLVAPVYVQGPLRTSPTLPTQSCPPTQCPCMVTCQSVSLGGRPQLSVTVMSPVPRGCFFLRELSLRFEVLRRPGPATVITPPGKLQICPPQRGDCHGSHCAWVLGHLGGHPLHVCSPSYGLGGSASS